jgi:hypothetical protein
MKYPLPFIGGFPHAEKSDQLWHVRIIGELLSQVPHLDRASRESAMRHAREIARSLRLTADAMDREIEDASRGMGT